MKKVRGIDLSTILFRIASYYVIVFSGIGIDKKRFLNMTM